jgi:phosphatidylglycerophosphate synthase
VHDAVLDRLQRTAVVCCLVMAGVALIVTRNWWTSLSVIGGGVLIGISFVSIRSGIESLATDARDRSRRPQLARAVRKMAGRYALLALLAYVMIARLRLHPLGLLAGASSIVAASALEAGRLLKK